MLLNSFLCLLLAIPAYSIVCPRLSVPMINQETDAAAEDYKWLVKKFRVPVDHFSFALNDTFEIKYLLNDTWQTGENPPIFFYTGNEGKIEDFAESTGFMWEIAPEYGALIIFAEHRYYGESMPYGNKSTLDTKHLGYLTAQQALADYVDLIEYLKSSSTMRQSPVIAFGGSYGGMLSAWLRMKYPHIVEGAIAASAPVLQFTGMTDCTVFYHTLTSNFQSASETCASVIRKTWDAINNLTSTNDGKQWLSKEWKLCKPIADTKDVDELKDWLASLYTDLATMNYPYESSLLPANPVKEFCRRVKSNTISYKSTISSLTSALDFYANFADEISCISTEETVSDLESNLWYYQACTEMVMPMCTDGINDMFEPEQWNFIEYSAECMKEYKVKPQPDLVCKRYGCADLKTASNIVFSNGLLDPWSGGGVLRNLSESAVAVIIPEGAHQLDLYNSHPDDPASVIEARRYHKYSISKWIKQYQRRYEKSIFNY